MDGQLIAGTVRHGECDLAFPYTVEDGGAAIADNLPTSVKETHPVTCVVRDDIGGPVGTIGKPERVGRSRRDGPKHP
jgi:hypothetical protein